LTQAEYGYGIDLGGTKIEGVVLAPDGEELIRHRIPTPREDYTATIRAIADLVGLMERETGIAAARVGVGIPGSASPHTGLVRNANSTWINGRPLERDLRDALARPVRLANDANCLALSESIDGAACDADSVFAVILGTGVGGGLVVNGRLVAGAHGLAGEWGHVPLPNMPDSHMPGGARRCFCGRRGCIETWLSGPAITQQYRDAGGHAARLQDVVAASQRGEALARDVLARFVENLAGALGMIVNVIDPEMFVLGGGVSNLPDLAERLASAIRPHVFASPSDRIDIDLRLARWGDSSGVRGAARLWEMTHDI